MDLFYIKSTGNLKNSMDTTELEIYARWGHCTVIIQDHKREYST